MSKKVLIIDDEPGVVKMVRYLLEKSSLAVVSANEGEEGIKLAAQEKPYLILMDIMMPVIDGNEATRRLKENETTRQIPIIMLSALGQEGDVAKSLELGAMDYIVKPFPPQELLERVKKILG
ncbi:MAG: response regulator [Elusimicrobia bacterium]|nr:response regulator [Elusimicrobiota bacterium]